MLKRKKRLSRAKPDYLKRPPGRPPKFSDTPDDVARFRRLVRDWKESGMSMEAFFSGNPGSTVGEDTMSTHAVYSTARRFGIESELPFPRASLTPEVKAKALTEQRRSQVPLDVIAWRYNVRPSTIRSWSRELGRPLLGNTKRGHALWWEKQLEDVDLEDLDLEAFLEEKRVPCPMLVAKYHELYPQDENVVWELTTSSVDVGMPDDEVEELLDTTDPANEEEANVFLVRANSAEIEPRVMILEEELA